MLMYEARACWPGTFIWVQPNLGWYSLPQDEFLARVRQLARDAGPRRYCLMVSEEIPPDWQRTVPAVLQMLSSMA